MVNAGRVAIVPQGEWSADATYKRLDAVTHNNTLYFAKKEVPAGTATSNTEYWSKSIVGGASGIATTDDAGIVKPDGTTITIDEDGTIHGQSEITVDGTTITLDEAKGIISLAKTLQDKINTIENKLPSTSVVNNNTTTQAGLALDARQANPNIEGTLAATVAQLNNDFSSINEVESYDNVDYGSHFEAINESDKIRCIRYKSGIRVITGAVRCISDINDKDYLLFSVPANFARNPEYGRHGVQAWLAAVSTTDGKSYNCIFYNDCISLWCSDFPKVGDILSVYVMY